MRRLPPGAVVTDAESLRERATDSWALALLRRARGDALAMPAAVVYPASTGEVAALMTWASETRMAVIPCGVALVCAVVPRRTRGLSFLICPA